MRSAHFSDKVEPFKNYSEYKVLFTEDNRKAERTNNVVNMCYLASYHYNKIPDITKI